MGHRLDFILEVFSNPSDCVGEAQPSCLEHAWEQEMSCLNYSGSLVSGQSPKLLIGLVCLSFLLSVHPLC